MHLMPVNLMPEDSLPCAPRACQLPLCPSAQGQGHQLVLQPDVFSWLFETRAALLCLSTSSPQLSSRQ